MIPDNVTQFTGDRLCSGDISAEISQSHPRKGSGDQEKRFKYE
jgi:hypothetical protein